MSLKMAWIANAWNFVMKLEQSINDPYSTLWKEVESAIQKIERDTNISTYLTLSTNDVNEIMLQQKAKWITSETTIEQILKFLIFYGNHSITSNILNIKLINGTDTTAYISYQVIHCSLIFQTIPVYEQCMSAHRYLLPLRIAFSDQQNYENILWSAILDGAHMELECNFGEHPELSESTMICYQKIIGFVLVFGKEHIGQLLSNTSESELQNKMMSLCGKDFDFGITTAITWSKMLKRWSNNVEMYGKKLILEQMQKRVKRNFMSAEIEFLYGKMLLNDNDYLNAKTEFIKVLSSATSFVFLSLSLQYLSKICKDFAEYEIGVKCLNRAYKLCTIDNTSYFMPSFVETKYWKNKRLFDKALNKIKCGYCGIKKGRKLRSCTGCMKVMYCNKK
eukprot:223945_1